MTMGHNGGPPLTFDTCQFFTFDCESVPNFFSCVVSCPDGTELIFEVSDRINQSRQFLAFLRYLVDVSSRNPALYMVGFNNQGYDWPLLNFLLRFQEFGPRDAYGMSKEIITTPWNDRNRHVIWPGKQLIRQLDLQKVHGLSPGGPRSTSLKQLQIAMQLDTVLEYQVDWDADLPHERMPSMLAYNRYDVASTKAFLNHSRKNIELRLKIGADVGLDLMNLSDVDMGEKIVIDDLEKQQPGITGTRGRGPKRTTVRHSMFLGALVFDYVRFETPEFQEIHQHFMTTTITETKGVFEGVTAQFGGMKWVFGTGGIHAAVPCVTHHATEQRAVITVDVSSYYPSVAVENTLAPEHLGQAFVNVYRTLKERKAEFKAAGLKMEETSTKLSANAVFGKGGSKYSCLSDPAFMLGITINGQLLLCMLAEQLAKVPTLEFIQANTDGITLAVDRVHIPQVDAIVQWWEQLTRLKLDYDRWEVVAQRDVNNYLAVEEGGKVKGKGAYEWRIGLDGVDSWHKDQSCKIVTKAVECAIVSGKPIAQTVMECDNAFEFMHTLKVNKSDRVVLGGVLEQYEDTQTPVDAKGKHPMRNKHVGGVDQQHVGRYYVAHRGEPLFKIMKPLAAKPHHFRPQAIEKGHLIAMANDLYDFDWNNLDRSHYIKKAQELLDNTGFNS